MPSERFFVDDELDVGTMVFVEGPELHHLAHVMRVKKEEVIELVNGRGTLAKGKVVSIEKRQAELEVLSCEKHPVEKAQLILGVPLMRPAKLEWVVEKGTELGADAFWIYPAEGSEKERLSENQMERLKTIEVAAMKQSGRLDLPTLKVLDSFEELFQGAAMILFGDPRPEAAFIWDEPFGPDRPIVFVTGPEKGFSKNELKELEKKGKGVRIHKNILRAETAPIAALALLYSQL